jgi:hypothetical protein
MKPDHVPARHGLPARSAVTTLLALLVLTGCGGGGGNSTGGNNNGGNPTSDNPTKSENLKPGTAAWVLANPATNHEIEGYASMTSVNKGAPINLFVNTAESKYTMRIFRIGWYGGAGGREVTAQPISLTGTKQPAPTVDKTRPTLTECHWTNPYTLTIPADWTSGFYLAQLTGGTSGKQAYIIFVVRDDTRASDFLFQSSVTTYQAYNEWGRHSLYTTGDSYVSFDRPYGMVVAALPGTQRGIGAGHFLNTDFPQPLRGHGCGWEINMVRFLEKEGYDVTYCTNLDVHENGGLLLTHKAFLSVGHDEYWSDQMRANVTAARDKGVNLGFFSSNTCDWHINYFPSSSGAPDRVITRTEKWVVMGNSQASLLGVAYNGVSPIDQDMTVFDPTSWVCAGTGLKRGDKLPGLVGYETDFITPDAPTGTKVVCRSLYPSPTTGDTAITDMTVYTAPSGATVFAAGSMQFCWGLDDYNAPSLRTVRTSTAAQQMARNVLAHLVNVKQ